MDNIKRVSGGASKHQPSSLRHATLQKSTTLNRKFVKKPVAKAQIAKRGQTAGETLARRQMIAEQMNRERFAVLNRRMNDGARLGLKKSEAKETKDLAPVDHATVAVAKARVSARRAGAPRQMSAQELKDRAIARALENMATMGDDGAMDLKEQMSGAIVKKRHAWRKRKLVVAMAMAMASIALLGYLVHLNLPDLSVRVAAMQHGIESIYPSYIPKGYRMDGLVAEKNGKVVINFSGQDGKNFTLSEEKSSWDSLALLSQFVGPNWGEDYTTIREQGLTIYVSGSDAAWMNGGVFYHIDDAEDGLTKTQIHDIVVSI